MGTFLVLHMKAPWGNAVGTWLFQWMPALSVWRTYSELLSFSGCDSRSLELDIGLSRANIARIKMLKFKYTRGWCSDTEMKRKCLNVSGVTVPLFKRRKFGFNDGYSPKWGFNTIEMYFGDGEAVCHIKHLLGQHHASWSQHCLSFISSTEICFHWAHTL